MNASADEQIRPYLVPGERLLWAGRPHGGIRFDRDDAFFFLFWLFWTGFSTFAEFDMVAQRDRQGMRGGAGFILLGLCMLVGRIPVDTRSRRNTVYGLT